MLRGPTTQLDLNAPFSDVATAKLVAMHDEFDIGKVVAALGV